MNIIRLHSYVHNADLYIMYNELLSFLSSDVNQK